MTPVRALAAEGQLLPDSAGGIFPDVPQTGDASLIWLVLAVVSAVGLGILTLIEKKGKREKK